MAAADVVVLGAGMAGLAAAERLAAAGCRVVVLEARDRIGGRIHTVDDPGLHYPVELGPEFVHGRPPELVGLIEELGLTLEAVPERARPPDLIGSRPLPDIRTSLETLLHASATGPDQPVAELIREHGALLARPGELEGVTHYIETFHAAELDRMGTRALAENESAEDDGDDTIHRVREGYGAVVRRMTERWDAERIELRLGAAATAIAWRAGEVRISVAGAGVVSTEVRAARAVVALPLPVLNRLAGVGAAPGIDPLPPGWSSSLAALHMGAAHRVVLGFDSPWWAAKGAAGPGFIRGGQEPFPVWWTALPSRAPILTGWVGGPLAVALSGRGDDVLLRAALDSVASIFGRDPAELRSRSRLAYVHDWSADPWAGGAYSYGGVGAIAARRTLTEPIEDTLFLAGEAVAEAGNNATVHGALGSGRRAAARVLGAG